MPSISVPRRAEEQEALSPALALAVECLRITAGDGRSQTGCGAARQVLALAPGCRQNRPPAGAAAQLEHLNARQRTQVRFHLVGPAQPPRRGFARIDGALVLEHAHSGRVEWRPFLGAVDWV